MNKLYTQHFFYLKFHLNFIKCIGIYFYVNVKNRPMRNKKKNNKVRNNNNESFKT